jgi:ATP citrate (pro-S)-lyase
VLNEQGAVFLLLSGGGASVVLADEVHNHGQGAQLANYGEYSGNPNAEETYLYTRQLIKLLLASPAPRKVLVIGGGVANFTDVRLTFRGVIRALDEAKEELAKQGVRVFVRRGGPFEREGLAAMRRFLDGAGLLGGVAGPELPLAEVVTQALDSLERVAQ